MTKTRLYRSLICLGMILALLLTSAFAESIDLSGMSNDEIVALLTKVNNEIVSRGINKTATLPQGSYIGGKDLPVGKYIYTCLAKGDDWGNLTVKTEGGAGKLVIWEVVSAPDEGESPETVFITLNEGDELNSGVPFSLTIMSGAVFQ